MVSQVFNSQDGLYSGARDHENGAESLENGVQFHFQHLTLTKHHAQQCRLGREGLAVRCFT